MKKMLESEECSMVVNVPCMMDSNGSNNHFDNITQSMFGVRNEEYSYEDRIEIEKIKRGLEHGKGKRKRKPRKKRNKTFHKNK